MASVVYNVTFTPTIGALGTLIEYKIITDTVWITPAVPANPTTFATYPLSLETGNTYMVRVSAYGGACTPKYRMITVEVTASGTCCPDGFTLSLDESFCYQETTIAPTIQQSNICLAPSQLAGQYSGSGTYLYDPGYTIRLVGSNTLLTLNPLWDEAPGQVIGPMNRTAVWVDTDCNGTKDALTAGQRLQITYLLPLLTAQTMYVGIGGDNTFKLELNNVVIVDCDTAFPAQLGPVGNNFNFWHLFPVDLIAGTNYLTFSGVGDGSTNDSFGATIYNNTEAEILTATTEGDLDIIFTTSDLIGNSIDIATCPPGYFLDTTGGSGDYICRQITTTVTNPC